MGEGVLGASWCCDVCYIQDTYEKFFGGAWEWEYWVLLGVVETIVGVGFIHCLFNLLVVGDCSRSNDPHLPLP